MMEKILQMIFSVMVWFLIKVNLFPNVLVRNQKETNSMKYAKQGPRKFMPLEYGEVTLENIKRACESLLLGKFDNLWYTRFRARTIFFSVESNSKLKSHLCSLYHTRTWKVYPFRNIRIRSILKPATTQKNAEEYYFTQCCICSQHSEKYSVFCGAKKPFSSRYVEIWEEHQTCRKENSQCGGWRILNRE